MEKKKRSKKKIIPAETKGYTVHVGTELLGRRPLYFASCVVASQSGREETGMRYDVDKQVFLDSPFQSLNNKPEMSPEEDQTPMILKNTSNSIKFH